MSWSGLRMSALMLTVTGRYPSSQSNIAWFVIRVCSPNVSLKNVIVAPLLQASPPFLTTFSMYLTAELDELEAVI